MAFAGSLSVANVQAQDGAIGALGTIEPAGGLVGIVGPSGTSIAELLVAVEQTVTRGQLIARFANHGELRAELRLIDLELAELVGNHKIDLRLHDLALAKAQEDLARARQSLQNYLELSQSAQVRTIRDQRRNAVTDSEHAVRVKQAEREQLVTRFGLARQRLNGQRQRAELNLSQAELHAPFDGTVIDVLKYPGAPSAGEILIIADLSRMHVVCEVYEGDLGRVRVGQSATISAKSLPNDITGEVVAIGRQIDVDRKVAKVRVLLNEADIAAKRIGMEVNATIGSGS